MKNLKRFESIDDKPKPWSDYEQQIKINQEISDRGQKLEDSYKDITYNELLNLVKTDKIKLINTNEYYINDYFKKLIKSGRNMDSKIGGYNNLIVIDERFVVVLNRSGENAIIGEYELFNPFVFGDVVVCPGHDTITCYNKSTSVGKTFRIR